MSVIISATSGLWADGTTWVGGVAPIATDDIVIAAGHTVTVAACERTPTPTTTASTTRLEPDRSV